MGSFYTSAEFSYQYHLKMIDKKIKRNLKYPKSVFIKGVHGAGKAGKRVVFQKKAEKNIQIQQLRLEKLDKKLLP